MMERPPVTPRRNDAHAAIASVKGARAGRDIIVNLYSDVPAPLRRYVRDREFLPLIEDRTRDFVGRAFVVERLCRHLDDASFPCGYVMVKGEPGIGKTALAAHLVTSYGWLHHFNIAAENIRSPEAFLGNLCAQLITRFGLDIDQLPEQGLRDSGFLVSLLNDAACLSSGPLIIVIDALDEAEPATVETGANRLLLPAVLPRGTYFVVTSRPKHDDQFYAEQVKLVVIDENDPENIADLRTFAERHTRRNEQTLTPLLGAWGISRRDLVDRLIDRSEGNFQYLRLVLAELIADGAHSYADADALPNGLILYYKRHWAAMKSRSLDCERLQLPVLAYLATARQPVPVEAIAEWADLNRHEVLDVLRAWLPFLNTGLGGDGETVYSIYHRTFAEYLDEEVGLTSFHARVADVALAKRGRGSGRTVT